MTTHKTVLQVAGAATVVLAGVGHTLSERDLAGRILAATGVTGGVVVHVGCGDGRLTVAFHANNRYIVQGLDPDARNVAATRQRIRAAGLAGKVTARLWSGDRLPYIDNLVNLVVSENLGRVSKADVMRVLAPGGVAYVRSLGRWAKVVKQWPKGMDEWTHYLHDPSNNAVAHDTFIAPVRRYQWLAGPRYSRHHDHMSSVSALVSANGRVFYIFDEAPRASILTPPHWKLIARDAFNGTLLWKRDLGVWYPTLWPLKSGPQLLARRLVAEAGRVYVTLSIDAPLSVLDAATGKTLHTFRETKATEEILCSQGVLFLSVAASGQPLRSDPKRFYARLRDMKKDTTNPLWTVAPRTIMAVQADSGKVLWKKVTPLLSLSLAADSRHVVFHDGQRLQCLDRNTGDVVWTSPALPHRERMRSSGGGTVVLAEDVILYSGQAPFEKKKPRTTTLFAVSAADGRLLWKAPHHPCGHMGTPDDLLVTGGLVWQGAVATGRDSGVMTGRALHTGEIESEFSPDVNTYWFHHRCYRAKATDKYLLFSRTGIEFIDYAKKHWICHHWVRGACHYGIMPANGLIYAPEHPCACYLEAKLYGFTALAPPSPSVTPRRAIPDGERLHTAPTTRAPGPTPAVRPDEWPTFRHDSARSGHVRTTVPPTALKTVWNVTVGGKLSQPVVAGGMLFVAAVDTHQVIAVDAEAGKERWRFTAGGRVDSPPTVWEARVLFGSDDGYVYCLRVKDGALLWRYRAAPETWQMGDSGQLASVWPVHGSVLIENGVLYCVAGRSMFVDGGLRLLRLDPRTGRKLSETIFDDRDPDTGENLQVDIHGLNMPVALPDVLSSDGRYVYMHSLPLTLAGMRKLVDYVPVQEQQGDDVHLFCPTGFLDDSLWHRSYWGYGRAWASGAGGYYQAGRRIPAGRPLVFDDRRVYGYGRLWQYYRWTTPLEYMLFASSKHPDVVAQGVERKPLKKKGKRVGTRRIRVMRFVPEWSDDVPVVVTGLVLTDKALFAAGVPDVVDEVAAVASLNTPATRQELADQDAAYRGRRGGLLVAASPRDGHQLAAYRLPSAPRFDALIAARGKLYLSTVDGKLFCFGTRGKTPLPLAPQVSLTPRPQEKPPANLPAPPRTRAKAPDLKLPSADTDFALVADGEVFRTQTGYLLSGTKAGSYALKRLAKPLTGSVALKVQLDMRPTQTPPLRRANGFLVFGRRSDRRSLVHCGIFLKQKKAAIIEGTGKQADRAVAAVSDTPRVVLAVTVDLATGLVKMTVGEARVELTLKKKLRKISYVGYCVQGAVSEFGPVELVR